MKVRYLNVMTPAKSLCGKRIRLALRQVWVAVATTASMAAALPVHAQGTPPGYEGKPLPAYSGQPRDCYQLLKNQYPYVQGGDYPVCLSVLRNLNRFCDLPPQYDRRRVHPRTKDLSEPAWEELNASNNLDLVREIYTASSKEKYRERRWSGVRERIDGLLQSGQVKLFSAEIDLQVRLGMQPVYMLEGYNAGDVPDGYDQPRLMIATQSAPRVPSVYVLPSSNVVADLWKHGQVWYLIKFDQNERRFTVNELVRPEPGVEAPIGTLTRCTIVYATDNR